MALLDISLPSVSNWTPRFASLVAILRGLVTARKHPEDYLAAQARREAGRHAVDRLL